MQRILVVSMGLIVTAAAGCASSASQQAQPAPGSDRVQSVTQPQTVDASSAVDCDGKKVGAPVDAAAVKLKGRELMAFEGRTKKEISICDVLKRTGKKVAIFQFAGVECLSCQDEAKELQAKIKNDAKGKDVAHVLVLTDFFKDYEDNEFAAFAATYAPTATVAYDEAKLWKHFSADPSQPNRATIMALSLKSDAIVFNKEGEQHKIFDAALSLLKGE